MPEIFSIAMAIWTTSLVRFDSRNLFVLRELCLSKEIRLYIARVLMSSAVVILLVIFRKTLKYIGKALFSWKTQKRCMQVGPLAPYVAVFGKPSWPGQGGGDECDGCCPMQPLIA